MIVAYMQAPSMNLPEDFVLRVAVGHPELYYIPGE